MLFGETNSPSILILNEFDSNTDDIKLSDYFPNKNFISGNDTAPFLKSLDSLNNPASSECRLYDLWGRILMLIMFLISSDH